MHYHMKEGNSQFHITVIGKYQIVTLSFFYDRYIIHRREKNNTEKLRNSGVTSSE